MMFPSCINLRSIFMNPEMLLW